MSSNLCAVPGCMNPRHKSDRRVYAKCLEHMRPIWRKNASKKRRDQGKISQQADEPCWLCHRTREQAAIAAAAGVTCMTCSVPPVTVQAAPAALAGTEALLVDAERDVLARIQVVVTNEQPLPGAADLRRHVLQADQSGIPVMRRHQVTRGSDGQ